MTATSTDDHAGAGAAVYNMPSGVPFLSSLAKGLQATYGEDLHRALIFLPTRRAVRQLTDILTADRPPVLLPRMRPLADVNPDEPPFEPGYLAGLVAPPIPGTQRRFELARLVGHYYEKQMPGIKLDAAAKLSLADPLIDILDDAAMEETDLARLSELEEIRDYAAQHFQNAAIFYEILQTFWPDYLADKNMMEPMARRVALLNALTELWQKSPPDYPVIIAGSTGTLAATARLMNCVANFTRGMVVLPGLDTAMPDKAWAEVDAEHPQSSMKNALKILGVDRSAVRPWPHPSRPLSPEMKARRQIISESLVPVPSTADWTQRIEALRTNYKNDGYKADVFTAAWSNLSVIEAHTDEEEALAIAFILRGALTEAGKTAALITPDPALARRVRARLRRWGVDVDYSQGEPLEEHSLGAFLTDVISASDAPDDMEIMASLAKHPMSTLSRPWGELRRAWQAFEVSDLRNTRRYAAKDDKADESAELLSALLGALAPLIGGEDIRAPQDWADSLTEAAQTLASYKDPAGKLVGGADRLWQGDAGEKAALLLRDIKAYGHALGQMSRAEFSQLFAALMRERVVRPRFGTHPRLQILGPLEARLIEADVIVLGGLNEGVWPAAPSNQPFLSRGMRRRLGLSLPERRYGLAAHDFAELATQPVVYLTRAQRSDDTPRVASRWLWRLSTLTQGALQDKASAAFSSASQYLDWARSLDHVGAGDVSAALRPEPRPALDRRWPGGRRQLSITQIKTWIRDPYAIYARKILGLSPLGDLNAAPGPGEYGSAIHMGLERFTKAHKNKDVSGLADKLAGEFETALIELDYPEQNLARERVRLRQAAADMVSWMETRREEGWSVAGIECRGKLELADVDFTLTGQADRIEKQGASYAIIDYKTGSPPSAKVVKAGFDPQLPLTAYMIASGAFDAVTKGPSEELIYMRVNGTGGSGPSDITLERGKRVYTGEAYAKDAITTLKALIRDYDKPKTAYYAQPRIQYMNDWGDYDHLSRRGEWALLGEGEGE